MQGAERRLNAQMLDCQLDDSLEALGDGARRLGGTALTDVRASTRRGVTGPARAKDRKDRATYQTVLDPRTRLVRPLAWHVPVGLNPKGR